ncbi:MAG: hypothetical protein VW683_00190 [Betaproteobacteria bacterium]
MFWTAEDIEPAVELAEKIFGKSGRIHFNVDIIKNVNIFTREFGKIWHGDLLLPRDDSGFSDSEWIIQSLNLLSNSIGKKVYLIPDGYDYSYPMAQSHSGVVSGVN